MTGLGNAFPPCGSITTAPCPHPTLVYHYSHDALTVRVTCWTCGALV